MSIVHSMDINKLESISKIMAAVFIPLAIAYMGNGLSESNKKKDTEVKLVELATAILSKEISSSASDDTKRIRKWAVDVINTYSGVKMENETQAALVNTTALPAQTKGAEDIGPWGIVFGADKTKAEAEWEVRKAEKSFQFNYQIFLRDGSYRSVALYNSRSAAEEGLGKLKTLRQDAYLVDIGKWCPVQGKETQGHAECKQ